MKKNVHKIVLKSFEVERQRKTKTFKNSPVCASVFLHLFIYFNVSFGV